MRLPWEPFCVVPVFNRFTGDWVFCIYILICIPYNTVTEQYIHCMPLWLTSSTHYAVYSATTTTTNHVGMDVNRRLVPQGQIGEVCIQGANVTAGYLNNPKANQEAFAGRKQACFT